MATLGTVADAGSAPESRLAELRRGLSEHADVVWALVLRETLTRFGKQRLGYLWALIEPTLVIALFYGSHTIAERRPPAGMDMFPFIATGVLPYTAFAHGAHRVAEAINANRPLLYYPRVRPLDLVLGRAVLEAGTSGAAFLVIMGAHALAWQSLAVDDALLVVLGMGLAAALGGAVGLLFCGLGQLSPAADRARGPMLRPLFWISGIFFTAEALPDGVRDGLLVNPVLHCTELVRDGWFDTYTDAHASVAYVLLWLGGVAVVGLTLERVVRRRIEV